MILKKLIFDDVITQIENGQSPTLTVSAGQQFRAAPAMAELVSSTSGGEKGGTIDSIHPFSLVLSIGCWPAAVEVKNPILKCCCLLRLFCNNRNTKK